jgi:hypothetical protein
MIMWRIVAISVLGLSAWPCFALDLVTPELVTEYKRSNFFTLNPATAPSDKMRFEAIKRTSVQKDSATFNPESPNALKLEQAIERSEEGGAIIIPLGGVALGLAGQFNSRDLTAEHNFSDRKDTETFRTRIFQARFIMDITSNLRGAFNYAYVHTANDILGNFFMGNDRTTFKSTLTGYSVGIHYNDNDLTLGAFYLPPMRGKAEVISEHKIVTASGVTGLSAGYDLSSEASIGMTLNRWFHKRGDFDDPSTSREDRTISLRGLELDQFYFIKQEINLGGQYAFTDVVSGHLTAGLADGVMIFDSDDVPGDRPDDEDEVRRTELKLAVAYQKNDFHLLFGAARSEKKRDRIENEQGTFGAGTMGSYKSTRDSLWLSVGLAQ